MSLKLYFKTNVDERCLPLSYFTWLMDFDYLHDLTLYEAERQDVDGFFWCREYEAPMDKNEGGCGKDCEFYIPRNGKSGCCKHYSLKFYEPSDKVKILHKGKTSKI